MPGLMVDEICEFLAAFTPTITIGTEASSLSFNPSSAVGNIYGGEMPDKPDACISVRLYGGALPHLVDNVDEPTFQVRVRSVVFTSGDSAINQCFNALHGLYERTIGTTTTDWYWNRLFALQSPVYLGYDDTNQRHQWSQNYRGFVRNPNRGGSGSVDH